MSVYTVRKPLVYFCGCILTTCDAGTTHCPDAARLLAEHRAARDCGDVDRSRQVWREINDHYGD